VCFGVKVKPREKAESILLTEKEKMNIQERKAKKQNQLE